MEPEWIFEALQDGRSVIGRGDRFLGGKTPLKPSEVLDLLSRSDDLLEVVEMAKANLVKYKQSRIDELNKQIAEVEAIA